VAHIFSKKDFFKWTQDYFTSKEHFKAKQSKTKQLFKE